MYKHKVCQIYDENIWVQDTHKYLTSYKLMNVCVLYEAIPLQWGLYMYII